MASNPLHSARESLIALFDENRKKVGRIYYQRHLFESNSYDAIINKRIFLFSFFLFAPSIYIM